MEEKIRNNSHRWAFLRILVVIIASAIFAVNIKSFVRTGLYRR